MKNKLLLLEDKLKLLNYSSTVVAVFGPIRPPEMIAASKAASCSPFTNNVSSSGWQFSSQFQHPCI